MIDEKKIEEAAKRHMFIEYNEGDFPVKISEIKEQCESDFKAGANWAQEEFKKSLWHDASEEPKKDANCLVCISYEYEDNPEDNYREYTTSVYLGGGWSEDHFPSESDVFILKWCYLDDILPQKGGSNV